MTSENIPATMPVDALIESAGNAHGNLFVTDDRPRGTVRLRAVFYGPPLEDASFDALCDALTNRREEVKAYVLALAHEPGQLCCKPDFYFPDAVMTRYALRKHANVRIGGRQFDFQVAQ